MWFFLMYLNPGYVLVEYGLTKNVVENAGMHKVNLLGAHSRGGEVWKGCVTYFLSRVLSLNTNHHDR